jgi:hypothetical protein
MTAMIRPTVHRRRLRTELRRLREEANHTREEVVAAMDWSLSKLIRIEAGTVSISTTDLKALLDHYGVAAGDRREEFVRLARQSRERMWWSRLKDEVSPALLTYIGFEDEASRISYYGTVFLPGLFQTEAYTRAIFTGTELEPRPEDAVESWVRIRQERQRQLFGRGPDMPRVQAVLDEAALHRQVGGGEAMAAQLRHLLDLATNPNISIRILPFSTGENPSMARPFIIFGFGSPEDDVVYLDSGGEDVFLHDAADKVADYRTIYDRLLVRACDEAQSTQLIKEIAAGMG